MSEFILPLPDNINGYVSILIGDLAKIAPRT